MMLALLAAAASPADGKTMMQDDWQTLAIYSVGASDKGPLYVRAHAGDLDGDGIADDVVLKLVCADGRLAQSSFMRETGIGSPTEKRQHGAVTITKEWGPATPQLMSVKPTYDVKTMKGNERRTTAGWTGVSLRRSDGLCAAASEAAATLVKSKSNITNN